MRGVVGSVSQQSHSVSNLSNEQQHSGAGYTYSHKSNSSLSRSTQAARPCLVSSVFVVGYLFRVVDGEPFRIVQPLVPGHMGKKTFVPALFRFLDHFDDMPNPQVKLIAVSCSPVRNGFMLRAVPDGIVIVFLNRGVKTLKPTFFVSG
eukprot:m.227357 g.227357  ORF g.227357 m.227357 type:complete len:148 (+) comp17322_c0_seq7:3128-3571(+)